MATKKEVTPKTPKAETKAPKAVKAVVEYSAIPVRAATGERADALSQGAGEINGGGAATLVWMIDSRASIGQRWLNTNPFIPSTQIGDKTYAWTQSILWGNHRASGANLMAEQRKAWAAATAWGLGFYDDDNIVWGNDFDLDDNIVWGNNLVWAAADDDNIVWGNLDDDNIVWGNNVVWGNGLIGMSLDDDNIVWGNNLDDDNIVWGNLDDDNIVWGNLFDDGEVAGENDDDNIVWGNSLAVLSTSGTDGGKR